MLFGILKNVIYGASVFFTGALSDNVDVLDILAIRFLLSFAVLYLLKILKTQEKIEFLKGENIEIIKENIEYDILKLDFKGEWLDNITELMLDVLCSDSKTIRVNQTNMPIEQVRKRYMQINDMHIRYLDDFVRKNDYVIHNFRNFYISAIYNAPIMIDSFYEEWVKEDMKRGAI